MEVKCLNMVSQDGPTLEELLQIKEETGVTKNKQT